MSWNPYQHYNNPIILNGRDLGSKEVEFEKVESIPLVLNTNMEIAVSGKNVPVEHWKSMGWNVLDAESISRDLLVYRSYIQRSRAEFSVAKNVYVATGSGWFSCRSVCYLAAGRPVVVQDTGFSDFLPTGWGLLTFTTGDEAARAVQAVESDYAAHQDAAREIAQTHFDSDAVLGHLLERVGLA